MNMAPAQSPSTRNTGIPVASSPKKSARKPVMMLTSIQSGEFMTARTQQRHERPGRGNKPRQSDGIPDRHENAAGRQRGVIEVHRKAQFRSTVLVDPRSDLDDLPAVPAQRGAKGDGRGAIEDLHPSRYAGRNQVEHDIGTDMA